MVYVLKAGDTINRVCTGVRSTDAINRICTGVGVNLVPSLRLGMPNGGAAASRLAAELLLRSISSLWPLVTT
ncbi:MAG: hypothetical protein V7K24_21075 [Nostoc sp.]